MFIIIKYKNIVKKFQWKTNFSTSKFKRLLAQIFSIKSNILGITNAQGFYFH